MILKRRIYNKKGFITEIKAQVLEGSFLQNFQVPAFLEKLTNQAELFSPKLEPNPSRA